MGSDPRKHNATIHLAFAFNSPALLDAENTCTFQTHKALTPPVTSCHGVAPQGLDEAPAFWWKQKDYQTLDGLVVGKLRRPDLFHILLERINDQNSLSVVNTPQSATGCSY